MKRIAAGTAAAVLAVLTTGCGGGRPAATPAPPQGGAASPPRTGAPVTGSGGPAGATRQPPPATGPASGPAAGPARRLAKRPDPKGGAPQCTRASYTVTGDALRLTVHFDGPAILVVNAVPERGRPVRRTATPAAGKTSHVFVFPHLTTVSRVTVGVLAGASADTCDAPRR